MVWFASHSYLFLLSFFCFQVHFCLLVLNYTEGIKQLEETMVFPEDILQKHNS